MKGLAMRPLLLRVLTAALLLFVACSHAGEFKDYSDEALAALLQKGQPVVLAVHAGWCPTCKKQEPIQKSLLETPALSKLTVLRVDYDLDTDVLKKWKVSQQSTMIALKGGKEVARSVGDTSRAGIEALMKKAF
jgi:thioredoxin 1